MKDYITGVINKELERLNNEIYYKDMQIERLMKANEELQKEVARLREDLEATEENANEWREAAERGRIE